MTTKPFEFEKALKELEEITSWFESSDVDLDAGLVKFERGMELASELKTHLAGVENRVEKIRVRFTATRPTAPTETTSMHEDSDRPPLIDEHDDASQTDLFGA
jgi:exodeoxyribonuclease VII small subunit